MFIKSVNPHVLDIFIDKGWENVIRWDIENNRVLFSTVSIDRNTLHHVRNILKSKGYTK